MTLPAVRPCAAVIEHGADADNPADLYAPGAIRSASDDELDTVRAYTRDFPEYEKLPHDAIVDAASHFVSTERYEERSRLLDAGVPLDWRMPGDDLMEGT